MRIDCLVSMVKVRDDVLFKLGLEFILMFVSEEGVFGVDVLVVIELDMVSLWDGIRDGISGSEG